MVNGEEGNEEKTRQYLKCHPFLFTGIRPNKMIRSKSELTEIFVL